MSPFKRQRPPPAVWLVLFSCGAFRYLQSERAARDTAKYEGGDGLCCGAPGGHPAEIVEYVPKSKRAVARSGAGRVSREGGGLYVIDGGKVR